MATDAQLNYLAGLCVPDRLAQLTRAEAGFLVGFLRGAPQNMSRAQLVYIVSLACKLAPGDVRQLIDGLWRMVDPTVPALPGPGGPSSGGDGQGLR